MIRRQKHIFKWDKLIIFKINFTKSLQQRMETTSKKKNISMRRMKTKINKKPLRAVHLFG